MTGTQTGARSDLRASTLLNRNARFWTAHALPLSRAASRTARHRRRTERLQDAGPGHGPTAGMNQAGDRFPKQAGPSPDQAGCRAILQIVERYFNTEGPMEAEEHYCIPPLERVDLDELLTLVARKKYFVLHAPRQTGKTSTLQSLAETINSTGRYRCVYVNVEGAQTDGEDVAKSMRTVLSQLAERAELMLQDGFVRGAWRRLLENHGGASALNVTLSRWARAARSPLVLLIDEIDTLQGDSLLALLRQLRAGYDLRPQAFPQSVILCGVSDVRDYVVYSSSAGGRINTGSCFNIKAKSLRLGDFTEQEMRSLLGQHTAETGQQFEPRALERIWELTAGQPWLINALACQICFTDKAGRDRSRPVTAGAVGRAKEALILQRVTHLDQLANALSEERVRRVILPMIAGSPGDQYSKRDLEYVRDLGLIAAAGAVRMANPIYAEVIPRELTTVQESDLEGRVSPRWYIRQDGSLDLQALLAGFQHYFREHSESWVERYRHREAGPQLVLHGYLQRVVNSGGQIMREYAVARGRSDLVVAWPRPGRLLADRPLKHVIECKVVGERKGLESTIRKGLEQTAWYMDRCGTESGHLVVFDLRPDKSWEERVFRRDPEPGAPPITVWGL